MKNSVMASPARIRTRYGFTQSSGGPARPEDPTASALVEELHLDARDLDQVVVLERVRRGADRLAVDGGALRAFHVGDEIALRPAREHSHLHARLAQGGERLGEL